MPKTITFFLSPQMLSTSVALPMEQLRAAESMGLVAYGRGNLKLDIKLASLDGRPVKTYTGMTIAPDRSVFDIAHSDITYLPALWRHPQPTLQTQGAIGDWLIDQHRRGNIIAGVGTGCCFLAETGLLDNRPATTHWFYFDAFEQHYPQVRLQRDYFITRADNLFCTGSVTSLADLTVYFIQTLYGDIIARNVERHFFHQVRQAYSEPYQAREPMHAHPDEIIAEVQSWMQLNSHLEIRIRELARAKQMSLRNFNRRFKEATQMTP